MLNTKMIAICCLMMVSASSALAAPICFKNAQEYADAKAKLPALLKSAPLYLVHNDASMIAGLKIYTSGNDLRLAGQRWHSLMGADDENDAKILEICVSGSTATVKLKGKSHNISLGGSSASIQGFAFSKSSNGGFKKALAAIKDKTGGGRGVAGNQ